MNTEQITTEWNRVTKKIKDDKSVDTAQLNAFFSRLQPQVMSDGFLMLTADNDFIKSWVESHYLSKIEQTLYEIHHKKFCVAIEVDNSQTISPADTSNQDVGQLNEKQDEKEPAVKNERTEIIDFFPTTPSSAQSTTPTSSLTFENFVIGDSNRMAYSMAVAVAEEPGRNILNPLFIYGRSGLGKTHLLRAIQNYILETQPNLQTVYVDSADFLSGYVEATLAHDKEKTSFKNFELRYQSANVLLIDDIQYFQGKEQTLDAVFRIFNRMVDEGKQVVLSADRAPKNITIDERYQSRFNSGGTFDIQPPGIETKMGIIKSFINEYHTLCGDEKFNLPEPLSRYIAENSGSNIRELKSAITKIIYAVNAFKIEELTIEKVASLLENHFSGGAMKKLSIMDIQKEVERYYDIPHSDLIGQKRDRKITYARKIAIYLSREMLDLSYNYIAKSFGGRDHTTIMYSVTNVETQMIESRELREEIENIKRRIKER